MAVSIENAGKAFSPLAPLLYLPMTFRFSRHVNIIRQLIILGQVASLLAKVKSSSAVSMRIYIRFHRLI